MHPVTLYATFESGGRGASRKALPRRSEGTIMDMAINYFSVTLPFIIAMWPGKVQKNS